MAAFSWSELCVGFMDVLLGLVVIFLMMTILLLLKRLSGFELPPPVRLAVLVIFAVFLMQVCSEDVSVPMCGLQKTTGEVGVSVGRYSQEHRVTPIASLLAMMAAHAPQNALEIDPPPHPA
jgi:hypothetical protein